MRTPRGYTYAEITVHGTVDRADGSVGVYAVPAVLIYPRHRRANRVGVVDWVNSAYYHFFPATTEFGTFQFTLLATENYLFDEGYTYVSIQWDKAVTEIFGPAAPMTARHTTTWSTAPSIAAPMRGRSCWTRRAC